MTDKQTELKIRELAEEILELVGIHSHGKDHAGMERAKDFVKRQMDGMPMEMSEIACSINDFVPALYFKSKSWDESKPRLLLVGHLDTVYPKIDHFDPRISGNKLYGPGAIDMKSGVVIILEILRQLNAVGKLQNISALFTVDEEHGTLPTRFPGFKRVAADHTHVMVYEPSGSEENKPDYKQKSVVVSRKGIVIAQMTAKASGGHSGVLKKAHERHSAVHELIYQSSKIKNLADYKAETTTNVGVFEGGDAFNVLAHEAYISFDSRMQTKSEFDRILEAYDQLENDKEDEAVQVGSTISAAIEPLPYSDANKEFFKNAQQAVSSKGYELVEEHRGGGSDANRLITLNNDLAILDSFGPIGSGEHTPGEFVWLDSLLPTLEISQEIIADLL